MGVGLCAPFYPQKMLQCWILCKRLKFPLNSPCHVLSFRAKNPTRLGTAGGKRLHFWGEEEGVGPAASGTQCWANIPAGCQGKE